MARNRTLTVQLPVFVSPEIRRFATDEGATFTCRGDLFTGSIYTGEVTRLSPVFLARTRRSYPSLTGSERSRFEARYFQCREDIRSCGTKFDHEEGGNTVGM